MKKASDTAEVVKPRAKTVKAPAKKPIAKAPPKEKKPHGRPTIYTEELAQDICRRISQGDGLRKICRDLKELGTEIAISTITGWHVENKDGFSERYTRACQARALIWAEEIVEISDDGSNDTYMDENGNERVNHEIVARSRLRTDTRKWLLAKVLPKVYGDKLDLNHGLQPDNPLTKLYEQMAGTPLRPASEDGDK